MLFAGEANTQLKAGDGRVNTPESENLYLVADNYVCIGANLSEGYTKGKFFDFLANGNFNVVSGNLCEQGSRVYSPNNKPTASDVGAIPTFSQISAGSLNAIKQTGLYGVTATVTERPTTQDGYLIATNWGNDYMAQIYVESINGLLYTRLNKAASGDNWSAWKRMASVDDVPTFSYSNGVLTITL